ncbi:TolC family protein [Algisphaera agarilytica]|uniref:Outer membrane protein TolC n=1 Tax=Algisphaera agarilytica TaxID=1385975 RepID=A0A7X0H6S1_9BACT|nr:TolC family protein [Algisphaera agarilytica]MBB6428845.1 outer membrane protein TolC [Algisphaera agarilytica]
MLFSGCQSYQPVPVNLELHRAEVASRLDEQETLRAFSQRLSIADRDAANAFDLSDGIDVAEAEVIALFYNPDLRLARLNAGVALATSETAGLWEDPVFGFDGAELLSPSGPFEYGMTLSLTIPVSGRLGAEQDRADAAYVAQLRHVVDAEWTTRARIRQAWVTWSVANERVELIDQVIQSIGQISEVPSRLVEAGELTRTEVRLLNSQGLSLSVERFSVAAEAEQARLNLLALMGVLPETQLTLVSALPVLDDLEPSELTERLIRTSTYLAALRADYQVAEEALRLEVQKQYPDIQIGGGLGSEDNDDRLLLGASLPIPVFNANRGGIAEAHANRDLARATVETEYERLAFELVSTQTRLKAAEQQRKVLERELVPMLDEQADEIDRLAELGEVNTLVLLETVTRRFEAKNQILELHQTALRDRIEVARLLGPAEAIKPVPVPGTNNTEPIDNDRDAAEGISP